MTASTLKNPFLSWRVFDRKEIDPEPKALVYHGSAGRARNRHVKTGPPNTVPHFFTDYPHTPLIFSSLGATSHALEFQRFGEVMVPPHSALSGIALERGFKGGLHLGTVSVYVITLGFTLCLLLAVKAGQDRVTCPPFF